MLFGVFCRLVLICGSFFLVGCIYPEIGCLLFFVFVCFVLFLFFILLFGREDF